MLLAHNEIHYVPIGDGWREVRVHKTTNVPVVFMALVLNGFEGCNIITWGIGRGGP